MLLLILADRHQIALVDQNVRSHQHRIGKKSVVGRKTLGDLVLVAVRPFEQSDRSDVVQNPGELTHLRHIRLAEQKRLFSIDPASEVVQRQLEHTRTERIRRRPGGE